MQRMQMIVYGKRDAVGRMFRILEDHGAGNEARTRDLHLGKVVLYQLSYSRSLRCSIWF